MFRRVYQQSPVPYGMKKPKTKMKESDKMKTVKVTIEGKFLDGVEHYSIKREYGLYKMDCMNFCLGKGHKNGFYACGINNKGFFDSNDRPCATVDDFAKAVFQA